MFQGLLTLAVLIVYLTFLVVDVGGVSNSGINASSGVVDCCDLDASRARDCKIEYAFPSSSPPEFGSPTDIPNFSDHDKIMPDSGDISDKVWMGVESSVDLFENVDRLGKM